MGISWRALLQAVINNFKRLPFVLRREIDSKALLGGMGRGSSWKSSEDKALARAWLQFSEDAAEGTEPVTHFSMASWQVKLGGDNCVCDC